VASFNVIVFMIRDWNRS